MTLCLSYAPTTSGFIIQECSKSTGTSKSSITGKVRRPKVFIFCFSLFSRFSRRLSRPWYDTSHLHQVFNCSTILFNYYYYYWITQWWQAWSPLNDIKTWCCGSSGLGYIFTCFIWNRPHNRRGFRPATCRTLCLGFRKVHNLF